VRIRVDWTSYHVEGDELTGAEILGIAGKDPRKHALIMRFRGGSCRVELDEKVQLTEVIDRFQTIPREIG